MSGTFNIAIAAFTDQTGESSEEGYKIANWIYEQIRTHQPLFPPGSVIEIWGPDETGSVSGEGTNQRFENASKKAEKIGAHILIFGDIISFDNNLVITPNFYLCESGFSNAQEITGVHQMGDPIQASVDFHHNPLLGATINRELSSRVIALSHFTVGLVYLAIEEYASAYQAFQQAEELADWKPEQGKEVLYLFLGNASLGLRDFSTAHSWFEKAIEVNPNYSRAYLGEGFTFYQESILPLTEIDNPSLDTQKLDLAIIHFQNGLTASYQPPLADISAKANFGLGRAHLTQSWFSGADLWKQAENELLIVTKAYEEGKVHSQELAAQAYGQLGLLYYIIKEDEKAIPSFKRALELGTIDTYKKQWANWLSNLYSELGDKAAEQYYIKTAESYSH